LRLPAGRQGPSRDFFGGKMQVRAEDFFGDLGKTNGTVSPVYLLTLTKIAADIKYQYKLIYEIRLLQKQPSERGDRPSCGDFKIAGGRESA
jgi:hypothetical protein